MAKVHSPLETLVALSKKIGRDLARLHADWKSHLGAGDSESVDSVPALRASTEELNRLLGATVPALNSLLEEAKTTYQSDVDTYSARLDAALRGAGLSVSGDASRPIVEGIVFIEVDASTPMLKINGQPQTDLRLAAVIRETTSILRDLQSRVTAPATFLRELESAYDEELRSRPSGHDQRVHVTNVHMRLLWKRQSKSFRANPRMANFREYPLELFRADLYAALISTEQLADGRALRVVSGSDTEGAIFMLLPSLGRTGYAGRLWFEEVIQ